MDYTLKCKELVIALYISKYFYVEVANETFQWVIETVAVQRNGENKMHVFHITTFDKSKKNAMDIARLKTKRLLKRKNIHFTSNDLLDSVYESSETYKVRRIQTASPIE